jgi:UPF0716 protein FxsA
MLLRLLLLFTLVPLVELTLLFWIAEQVGSLFTLWLIIITGLAGAWLARHQGLQCWRKVQEQIARGQLPADSLLEGLMILLAGAVLITPGVLTDLVGFALLVPPIRRLLRRYLAARIRARIAVHSAPGYESRPSQEDDVIDVEHRPSDDAQA